ncbi:MAG: hypothetical protein O3C65_12895 [Proteobacteria bacterium]|nr:hypothetical protein [Pseudomonadota bacterium]
MMRPILAACALALALAGCSFVGSIPGVDRISTLWTGGSDDAPQLTPVAGAGGQSVPAPLLGANRGDGALAAVAGQPGWIVDPVSNCATSNPFARPDEEIRWFGPCEDGRLDGKGTLVWYVERIESERNDGTFRAGEFHGEVITTYPDGEVIVGSYVDGVRDGAFTVISTTGVHLRAMYRVGELVSESEMTVTQVDDWRNQRAASFPGVLLAQAASQSPQVTASSPSANRQVIADAPAASQETVARLAAQDAPAPRAPSVQLARADATDRITQPRELDASPRSLAFVVSRDGAALSSTAPTGQSSYAQRTAHVTEALGGRVQVAALETAAPPVRQLTVATVATPAAPVLAPDTSFAATGTVLITGDGRPVPLETAQVVRAAPVRLAVPRRAEALRIERDDSGSLAQRFAGRDGPWVIGANNSAITLRGPAVARVPVAPVAVLPAPLVSPGSLSAAPLTADTLFSTAYRLELQGRYGEAERQYHDLLIAHPSSPAALLANARLEALVGARGTVQMAQSAPPPDLPSPRDQYVVSANSPTPRFSGLPPAGTVGNPALALESALINKTVCSQNGLYANDARWCGIVTFDEGQFMRVEVTDIKINGFGQIGITRSTCTGNTFLTWFSRGTSIRVPKRCMAVVS